MITMRNTYETCRYTADLEDIILWPDATYCYRYELHEYKHKSDDYLVYNFGTKEYTEFLFE